MDQKTNSRDIGARIMDLIVDHDRLGKNSTGIYVRAKYQDRWGSYDIYELDSHSLLCWLKSRGGDNQWAENVVGMLLNHPNRLHVVDPNKEQE